LLGSGGGGGGGGDILSKGGVGGVAGGIASSWGGGGGSGGGSGGGAFLLQAIERIKFASGARILTQGGGRSNLMAGYGAGGGVGIRATTIEIENQVAISTLGGITDGSGTIRNGGTLKVLYGDSMIGAFESVEAGRMDIRQITMPPTPTITPTPTNTGSPTPTLTPTPTSSPTRTPFPNNPIAYVSDRDAGRILKVDLSNGARGVLSGPVPGGGSAGSGPAFLAPTGMTDDTNQNLYVADSGLAAIFHVDQMTGNRSIISGFGIGSGVNFMEPNDVAREASGSLLVSDLGLDRILRVNPNTGARRILSGNIEAQDILAHEDGSIYAVGAAGVTEIDPIVGTISVLLPPSSYTIDLILLSGIVQDATGDLLVCDSETGAFVRVDRMSAAQSLIANVNTLPLRIDHETQSSDLLIGTAGVHRVHSDGSQEKISGGTTGGGVAFSRLAGIKVLEDFSPDDTPTPTLTFTPSPTSTRTPTFTYTSTFTPTNTFTSTFTSTPIIQTNTPTSTRTSTFTATPTVTPTNTPTETPTDSPTPTVTPTETLTPTWSKFDFDLNEKVDPLDLLILFGEDRIPDATEMFEFSFYWFEEKE
ncbi:MAG: hypothetical protein KC940_11500, partial [Candidatus Omnitrophica bacterium]|nr:hypothetical protein [Candidatus Omnitrophota bacterium]